MNIQTNLRAFPNVFSHPVLSGRPMAMAVQRDLDFGPDRSLTDLGEHPDRRAQADVRLHPSPDLRVLLADDDPVSQMMTRAVLARWSISMDSALDGRDAIRQAIAMPFDIILMDIEMPEGDGFEATTFIRGYEEASGRVGVPIVAYSNDSRLRDDEAQERMARAGMDDVLAKPCHTDSLAACLFKWLPAEFMPAAEVKARIQLQRRLDPRHRGAAE
jgi:CheY-like chemotaxis protein